MFFYFFGVNKGVSLAPTDPHVRWRIQTYIVLLSPKVCVLNWFYAFERLILIVNEKLFKALDLETISSDILIKKKNLFMSWFYLGFVYLFKDNFTTLVIG